MKSLIAVFIAALVCLAPSAFAADKADPKADLAALVDKVQAKLSAGKTTEKDLAGELKEFDQLLATHKTTKTDDVAQILVMKALLYAQVFDDSAKAIEIFEQLKKDFPETTQGKKVDGVIAKLKEGEEGTKIRKSLVVGAKFPDFDVKDLAGKPLSVGKYKGKVVLVDFWATWCGPCVGELPHVLSTYEKYNSKGFEVIGVSLDREREDLDKFIKARKLPWAQYLDDKGVIANKYGVESIPTTYLIDGSGKIIAQNLRGDELEKAVAKALAAK